MKVYCLVDCKEIEEHLSQVSSDTLFITKETSLEDNSILFIHLQSFKENITTLFEDFKNCKIALLSDNPSFKEGYRFLGFNIKAYANTYMAMMHYKQLIGMLKSGNSWFYPEFTTQLLNYAIESSSKDKKSEIELEKLSNKEKEVVFLVVKSLKNLEIAQRLNIKERTVKQHLSNIYAKLDIHDRVSLALMFR